ncbi:MAG TPA: lysophospholipid acyltransferase family protein, partial [Longimicrobiales bacterium]|nr:lysophospholipid acyltransferase family protein [Longimicrobiales bacterium]
RVLQRLGYGTARGSSTRGGVRALRELLRAGRSGRVLAVTPDGPQGPREVMKTGPLVLAGRSGVPIIPIGVGMSRAWRLSSWDRFSIPRPFSRVHIRYGDPVHVPPDLDEAGMEALRERVQAAMDELTASARQTAGDPLASPPEDPASPASSGPS